MIYLGLLASLMAMAAIATWAYRNIAPGHSHLPMQWSGKGAINWQAPRLVALLAVPALMVAIMALIFILSRHDEAERNMALAWIALIGPAIQVMHLGLLARAMPED